MSRLEYDDQDDLKQFKSVNRRQWKRFDENKGDIPRKKKKSGKRSHLKKTLKEALWED